ncbi:MAG: hypothetical protein CMJ23_07825 [Phycisphaerae bacterium]|nr:hypothetical protein [Phycisphaerae bacterium]
MFDMRTCSWRAGSNQFIGIRGSIPEDGEEQEGESAILRNGRSVSTAGERTTGPGDALDISLANAEALPTSFRDSVQARSPNEQFRMAILDVLDRQ